MRFSYFDLIQLSLQCNRGILTKFIEPCQLDHNGALSTTILKNDVFSWSEGREKYLPIQNKEPWQLVKNLFRNSIVKKEFFLDPHHKRLHTYMY